MSQHTLLFYDYVPDILERRGPHREAHLAAIRSERDAGRVTLAGAIGDPPNGAVILFEDVEEGAVGEFARRDPYVLAGLVTRWRAEPWKLVL